MGVKPVAIAGTSIGAIIGAGYAAGMTGREMRRYAIHVAHNRTDVMRRMMRARAGKLRDLFGGGLGDATRLDAELLCEQFLPESLPEDFSGLAIPLTVIASDLYRRREVVFSHRPAAAGACRLDLAADHHASGRGRRSGAGRRRRDQSAAVRAPARARRRRRRGRYFRAGLGRQARGAECAECLYATVLVMTNSIISEKLRHGAPDLLVQPKVGSFRALGFLQASAILRAADPVKAEFKEKLERLLGA